MEILDSSLYPEYEKFCLCHPQGCFTQSTRWYGVKNNWQHEVVVSRSAEGAIVGGISVLIQRVPLVGTSFLYAPRGPVCDLHDRAASITAFILTAEPRTRSLWRSPKNAATISA